MEIIFSTDIMPDVAQVIQLYDSAGLPRPLGDKARIELMYHHSNLVVTAWHGEMLVGAARSITDWAWSCYLADLAIHNDYKNQGIGRKLVEKTREKLGPKSMILLLSVATAMDYYPKIGFSKQESSFIIHRSE